MIVLAECVPVVILAHIVLTEPTIALEHTLGEDNINVRDLMHHAPYISKRCNSCALEEIMYVDLMQHTLDVRKSYLERGMLAANFFIDDLCKLIGDDTLAVITENVNALFTFNTVILADRCVAAVVFDSDNVRVVNGELRIN